MSERRPSGRPLDRSRDAVILRAALEVLAESGYDRLTMDMVAARAQAGKASLYRRWPSKAALVADALMLQHPVPPEPDTGTLLGDLRALLTYSERRDKNLVQAEIVAGVATACSRDPDLARALQDSLRTNLRVLRRVLERAMERGEVPEGRDIDAILEIVPALSLWRMLTSGGEFDQGFARWMAEQVIYPLAVSPLQAQS